MRSPELLFPTPRPATSYLVLGQNITHKMSADTRPIPASRFAAALKELSIGMLHLKVLEIRNSIAHLQYSNDQLRPFAEGSATALEGGVADGPDQDCVEAIRENEAVIDRMAERIALVRAEVEDRGVSWAEFQSKDEVETKAEAENINGEVNGRVEDEPEGSHAAWRDGTFQTGTIQNGEVHLDRQAGRPEGGSLTDEELTRALEERLRDMSNDEDGGMHL